MRLHTPLLFSAMTMEELLESLTKKTRTECEESHRLLIAAFNGLAGWYIINEQVKNPFTAFSGLSGWYIINEVSCVT